MAFFYDILYGDVKIPKIPKTHTEILLFFTSRLPACDDCNGLMNEMLKDANRKALLDIIAPESKVTRVNIAFAYTTSKIQVTSTPPDFGTLNNTVVGFGFDSDT